MKIQKLTNIISRASKKLSRILTPYFTPSKKKKYERTLLPILKKKNILIVIETTFGWSSIMRQRPQQIALGMGEGVTVVYHSAKDKYENPEKLEMLRDGVYLSNLDLYRKFILKDAASELSDIKKILIVYSTDVVSLSIVEKYRAAGFEVIYEYVDNIDSMLAPQRVYEKQLAKREWVISNGIKTVCTATSLYDSVSKKTPSVLVTNGCDREHFSNAEKKVPRDMAPYFKKDGRWAVGYYGAMAEWLDYSLLKRIADDGRYDVFLLGTSYDSSLEKSGILSSERVHFLGKKSYEELPVYSSNFDAALIPFKKCPLTDATSPVKLFEYMAAGIPVVSCDIAECRKYQSVLCAADADEFMTCLLSAVEKKNDEKYMEMLRRDAEANTWESKCREILAFALSCEK